MSSLLRQGFRALAQPVYSQTTMALNTSVRCMSVDGIKSFRDREASAEVRLYKSLILTPGSGLQLVCPDLALSTVKKPAATYQTSIGLCVA